MATERLQKILAAAGIASRRKAEQLIEEGRVTVNGQVVDQLGARADAAHDAIKVDGKRVKSAGSSRHSYLLVHKPRGVLSTTQDDRGRPTVLDLVGGQQAQRLAIAGRLDYHSEGLILLTDDGELIQTLTHPQHDVPKTYHAKVKGEPSEAALDKLRRGIRLEDGPTRPAHVERLGLARTNTWVEITITEGRNRQVRRMFDAIRHPVQRLVRVGIGALSVEGLKPGEFREASDAEMAQLRALIEPTRPHSKSRRSKPKGRVAPRSGAR